VEQKIWKKGKELIEKIPELKTFKKISWGEYGKAGDNFRFICELLKANAIPAKTLSLSGDEK